MLPLARRVSSWKRLLAHEHGPAFRGLAEVAEIPLSAARQQSIGKLLLHDVRGEPPLPLEAGRPMRDGGVVRLDHLPIARFLGCWHHTETPLVAAERDANQLQANHGAARTNRRSLARHHQAVAAPEPRALSACRQHLRVRLRRPDSACAARTQTGPELRQRGPQVAPVPRRTHPASRTLHRPQSTRGQEEKLVGRTRPPAHPDPPLASRPCPDPADSAVRHADAVAYLEPCRHPTLVEEGSLVAARSRARARVACAQFP
jgi:hypothetical protein